MLFSATKTSPKSSAPPMAMTNKLYRMPTLSKSATSTPNSALAVSPSSMRLATMVLELTEPVSPTTAKILRNSSLAFPTVAPMSRTWARRRTTPRSRHWIRDSTRLSPQGPGFPTTSRCLHGKRRSWRRISLVWTGSTMDCTTSPDVHILTLPRWARYMRRSGMALSFRLTERVHRRQLLRGC